MQHESFCNAPLYPWLIIGWTFSLLFFHWTLTSAFSICLSAWPPICFELECLRNTVLCQYWNPFPSSSAVPTVWISCSRLVSLCILFSELQWRVPGRTGMVVGNDSSGWTWDNISGNPVKAHLVTMINQGKLFYIQQFSRQLWLEILWLCQGFWFFKLLHWSPVHKSQNHASEFQEEWN